LRHDPGLKLIASYRGQTLEAGVNKTVTITLLAANTYSGTVRNSGLEPVLRWVWLILS